MHSGHFIFICSQEQKSFSEMLGNFHSFPLLWFKQGALPQFTGLKLLLLSCLRRCVVIRYIMITYSFQDVCVCVKSYGQKFAMGVDRNSMAASGVAKRRGRGQRRGHVFPNDAWADQCTPKYFESEKNVQPLRSRISWYEHYISQTCS